MKKKEVSTSFKNLLHKYFWNSGNFSLFSGRTIRRKAILRILQDLKALHAWFFIKLPIEETCWLIGYLYGIPIFANCQDFFTFFPKIFCRILLSSREKYLILHFGYCLGIKKCAKKRRNRITPLHGRITFRLITCKQRSLNRCPFVGICTYNSSKFLDYQWLKFWLMMAIRTKVLERP